MLDAMPMPLFYEWAEFAHIQPFTPQRDDLRFAMLAALIANMFRTKGRPPVKVDAFMPNFDGTQGRRKARTVKEMAVMMNMFAQAQNVAMKRRTGSGG